MTCVEILGGADATLIANELRHLDSKGLLEVAVRSAPASSEPAVALCVAAPSLAATFSDAQLMRHVDVVFGENGTLRDQTLRLWFERISVLAAALTDDQPSRSPAVLHAFDQRWAAAADRRLRRLQAAFTKVGAAQGCSFEHIGSTSVPDLSAKPILDLQVCVPRLRYDPHFDHALHRVGYKPAAGSRPDSPGVTRDTPRGSAPVADHLWEKRLFVSPDPAQPVILHVRQCASPWARLTVQFRDWLRAHPVEVARYERMKQELARVHESDADYDDYTRGKTAYFDDIQCHFENWSRQAEGDSAPEHGVLPPPAKCDD